MKLIYFIQTKEILKKNFFSYDRFFFVRGQVLKKFPRLCDYLSNFGLQNIPNAINSGSFCKLHILKVSKFKFKNLLWREHITKDL